MSTLICHTRGCQNQDAPIQLNLSITDLETGQLVYVDEVVCGLCRQPISDVDPPFQPGAWLQP